MADFLEKIKYVTFADIQNALVLMVFCVAGVFAVLLFFYIFIKVLQKIFPPKDENPDQK